MKEPKTGGARTVLLLAAACSLAGAAGCGGGDDGPAVLAPVTGKVLVDNQPTPNVSITFSPTDGTTGTGAYAATNEKGEFTLTHRSGREGIEPGSYKVVLSRYTMPGGGPIPPEMSAADAGAIESLPRIYTEPERTPLLETIPKEGKQIDLQVSSR